MHVRWAATYVLSFRALSHIGRLRRANDASMTCARWLHALQPLASPLPTPPLTAFVPVSCGVPVPQPAALPASASLFPAVLPSLAVQPVALLPALVLRSSPSFCERPAPTWPEECVAADLALVDPLGKLVRPVRVVVRQTVEVEEDVWWV